MPTITPLYCNRFFPRCKYFFLKKPCFFKEFPDRTQQFANSGNNGSDHPLQRFPRRQPEGQCPQQQPRCLGRPDIPAANAEGQMEPGIPHRRHKQTVAEGREPRAERAEQFINRPQSHAHQQRGGCLPGGNSYRRHPNRRLAQEPRWRGSS